MKREFINGEIWATNSNTRIMNKVQIEIIDTNVRSCCACCGFGEVCNKGGAWIYCEIRNDLDDKFDGDIGECKGCSEFRPLISKEPDQPNFDNLKSISSKNYGDDGIALSRKGMDELFNECSTPIQPEKVSDNFRINIIPELTRKELEERCVEMYEKIEAMKLDFSNKEDDYEMEIEHLTESQASILEEVERLRDSITQRRNDIWNKTAANTRRRVDFGIIIEELNGIIIDENDFYRPNAT